MVKCICSAVIASAIARVQVWHVNCTFEREKKADVCMYINRANLRLF